VRHASLQDDSRRREGGPHLLHLHDQDQQEQARPRKELSHGHGLADHFVEKKHFPRSKTAFVISGVVQWRPEPGSQNKTLLRNLKSYVARLHEV
jgi:hypothetical protein